MENLQNRELILQTALVFKNATDSSYHTFLSVKNEKVQSIALQMSTLRDISMHYFRRSFGNNQA